MSELSNKTCYLNKFLILTLAIYYDIVELKYTKNSNEWINCKKKFAIIVIIGICMSVRLLVCEQLTCPISTSIFIIELHRKVCLRQEYNKLNFCTSRSKVPLRYRSKMKMKTFEFLDI